MIALSPCQKNEVLPILRQEKLRIHAGFSKGDQQVVYPFLKNSYENSQNDSGFNFAAKQGLIASILLHLIVALCLLKLVIPSETTVAVPFQVVTLIQASKPVAQKVTQPSIQNEKPASLAQKNLKQPQKTISKKIAVAPTKPAAMVQKKQEWKPADTVSDASSASAVAKEVSSSQNTGIKTAVEYAAPNFDAAYLRNPAPEYPSAAKRRRMQGVVLLNVSVSENGHALQVRLKKSSGFAVLDIAAQKAVSKWRFVPAKRDNIPVKADVVVPVEFLMKG